MGNYSNAFGKKHRKISNKKTAQNGTSPLHANTHGRQGTIVELLDGFRMLSSDGRKKLFGMLRILLVSERER